jgi:hypothetical protein
MGDPFEVVGEFAFLPIAQSAVGVDGLSFKLIGVTINLC